MALKLTQIEPLGVSQLPAEKCQKETFEQIWEWALIAQFRDEMNDLASLAEAHRQIQVEAGGVGVPDQRQSAPQRSEGSRLYASRNGFAGPESKLLDNHCEPIR
jgi:hypothetical protein